MQIRTFLLGAAGGLLGGVGMKAVVHLVDPASFGLSAETDAQSTQTLLKYLHRPPVSNRAAEIAGAALHYAFAMAAGAAYGSLSQRSRLIRVGKGTAFGSLLFLVGDELAVSVSGLEHPLRTPIRSHLSAWSAHIVYGLLLDGVVSLSR